MSLLVEFDFLLKGERSNWLLETWEAVVPRGVSFGCQIYRSGKLRRMRRSRNTAQEVLDWLGEMV